ncbi:ABC transporter substrate-binding protein [Saccharopolyspora sp. K220]|uniref:ABC transporter substrate-binding protein n=1 Tax=Saccharopolyspora soli TaxID=2926618 RepID=UPI001F58C8CB|nr:ABC transporter substrate-binding protein [Saccharopolyspora soli]MCI2423017.1 ABC transporter substrate-binding protein [Saccharopolyspora soli]
MAAAFAASVLLLTSCATPGAGDVGGPAQNILVVTTPTEPDSLDPTNANNFAARLVFTSFCEKLYDVDDRLNIVPQLAAALPTFAADGKSLDIPVRPGVTFNDGTPLDAAAVKETLDRHRTLKTSARKNELSAIADVSVRDPLTVHIELKRPSAPLVAQLADRAGLIMSPTALQKLGDDFSTAPICVGPFTYSGRLSGSEIQFTKSDYYYDADKVKLRGIVYRFINNSGVATANLQAGSTQVAEHLDPSDALKLQAEPDAQNRVLRSDTVAYQSIHINVRPQVGTPLSKSVDLRRAFEMSIDRNALNKAVWNDQNVVDCQPLPVQSALHSDVNCTPYDPEGARRIIAASGLPTPIPVELMVLTGSAPQREAQVIQAMANDVGFDVSVKPLDQVSALKLARSGDFDVYLQGWSGRVDPDGNTNDLVTTGGSNNFNGLSSPELDSLVQQAGSTSVPDQRRALYAQIIRQVADTHALLYLYHNRWFVGANKNVQGIEYYPDGIPRFKTAYFTH